MPESISVFVIVPKSCFWSLPMVFEQKNAQNILFDGIHIVCFCDRTRKAFWQNITMEVSYETERKCKKGQATASDEQYR